MTVARVGEDARGRGGDALPFARGSKINKSIILSYFQQQVHIYLFITHGYQRGCSGPGVKR